MAKERITNHGLLHDFINYRALIEAQSSNITFLDSVKGYKINKNYNSKPKIKKLTYNKKIIDKES